MSSIQKISKTKFKLKKYKNFLPQIVLTIAVVLLIVSVIYAFIQLYLKSPNHKESSLPNYSEELIQEQKNNFNQERQESASLTTKKITPDQVNMSLLFSGDVFWGRYIHDWSQASNLKEKYPFSALDTFEPEKYDAWIANLECPITEQTLDSDIQENLLKFACRPEYLKEAKKYFKAFSLANNHTDNMEEYEGFKQTRKFLDQAGIQYFGHFDNAKVKDICEVVSLPVKLIYSKESLKEEKSINKQKENFNQINLTLNQQKIDKEINQKSTKALLPIALCGYHNVFKLPLENELAVINNYAKYLPTFIMPHQGAEYGAVADSLQESYFRKMIDLGADAVLGNHPHSIHNTESYKGKLIAYSLGNFIFDQQASIVVTRSLIINLNLNLPYDENLQKWLDLGEKCQEFQDTCLEQAKKENLQKPKFTITYQAFGSDNSDKLTKRASSEVEKWILDRARWQNTLKELTKAESLNKLKN